MTMKEYAHQLSEGLRQKPTHEMAVKVANRILNTKVDGIPISDDQIEALLSCMQDELGNWMPLMESFDNKEVLTIMNQVRQLIAASDGKK